MPALAHDGTASQIACARQMHRDKEFIEHDLVCRTRNEKKYRLNVALINVHCDAFDLGTFFLRKPGPESIQRLFLPSSTDPDHVAGLETTDNREVYVSLLHRLLVDINWPQRSMRVASGRE